MNMNARIDVWEANAYTQQSVDNPSDEQALNLLARLDGKRSTIFCVVIENGDEFVIGGGPARFIIYTAKSDERVEDFYFDRSLNGTTRLFVGGQPGDYFNSTLFPKAETEGILIEQLRKIRSALR